MELRKKSILCRNIFFVIQLRVRFVHQGENWGLPRLKRSIREYGEFSKRCWVWRTELHPNYPDSFYFDGRRCKKVTMQVELLIKYTRSYFARCFGIYIKSVTWFGFIVNNIIVTLKSNLVQKTNQPKSSKSVSCRLIIAIS